MRTVRHIYDFLDKIAPFEHKLPDDPVGLMVGSMDDEISSVILALDATPNVVSEALKEGAQLIITHHPVIYHPLKTLESDSVPYLAARHGINIISAHTNLDMANEGVNKQLALSLGLDDIVIEEDICMASGKLKQPMSTRDFALHVKQSIKSNGVRYTQNNKTIRTVAVTGGSGSEYIPIVTSRGIDAFVTGEIPHHMILAAVNLGLVVVDGGHFKTEDVVIEPLRKMLEDEFCEITFKKSQQFDDTIDYI